MSRKAFSWVLVALVMTGFMVATTAVGQEQRKHSGVIVNVAPSAHTITVEEMGPWAGPNTIPQRLTVRLTSQTKIELTSRSENAQTAGGWPGDFKESPLETTDLHPGDFATVTATGSGGELVAESIAVVRPAGDPFPPGEARPRAAAR